MDVGEAVRQDPWILGDPLISRPRSFIDWEELHHMPMRKSSCMEALVHEHASDCVLAVIRREPSHERSHSWLVGATLARRSLIGDVRIPIVA